MNMNKAFQQIRLCVFDLCSCTTSTSNFFLTSSEKSLKDKGKEKENSINSCEKSLEERKKKKKQNKKKKIITHLQWQVFKIEID